MIAVCTANTPMNGHSKTRCNHSAVSEDISRRNPNSPPNAKPVTMNNIISGASSQPVKRATFNR